MSENGSVIHSPVHPAGLVCEVSTAIGLPLDPARLRSWHSREGLMLGHESGGWRRYNDFDLLAAILLRSLSVHGIPAGELAGALPTIRAEIEWAVRHAAQGEPDADMDVFVAAARRDGKDLMLFAGSKEPVLEKATALSSLLPSPVTLLNLSTLAERVREAMTARQLNRSSGA